MLTLAKKDMPIDYKDIKTDRQWRACTGLSEEKFLELSIEFGKTYERIFSLSLKERRNTSSNESVLTNYKEYLFFILYSLKNGLSYDVLGFNFGMSLGSAKKNQTEGIGILKYTLRSMNHAPKRFFENVEAFEQAMEDEDKLILDGMEHRVQRSANQDVQKDFYSGKKKPYSKKSGDKQL